MGGVDFEIAYHPEIEKEIGTYLIGPLAEYPPHILEQEKQSEEI